MTPSNYHLLCLPTFNVLSHTLSQPMMSSTILLPFITHLDFLHSYLLHYTQLQLPLQQPPHHQFRLLLRCPSSTQLLLQHPQISPNHQFSQSSRSMIGALDVCYSYVHSSRGFKTLRVL